MIELLTASCYIQARLPFTIDEIVLLTDHLHCIWTPPDSDADFSAR